MDTGVRVSYLTTAAQSAGEFGLYRWDFGEQAAGPAPHFHRAITESFFVRSGVVTLFDGTETHEAGPALVPFPAAVPGQFDVEQFRQHFHR